MYCRLCSPWGDVWRNFSQVWQHLTLTYGLLAAAMAALAGCSDWGRYVRRWKLAPTPRLHYLAC